MKRLLVVIAAAVLLLTGELRAADAPAKPMTAQELLDRWEAALARTLTCSVHNDLLVREQYPWRPKVMWRHQMQTCYRERNGRFHYFGQSIRDLSGPDVPPDPVNVQDDDLLWDGKLLYSYHCVQARDSRSVAAHTVGGENSLEDFRRANAGSVFDGRMGGERTPIPQLMRGMQVELDDQMRPINGSPCYFLKATGAYGLMKLWLDPQHDYNMARFEQLRSGHDMYYGRPLPRPNFTGGDPIVEAHGTYEVTRFDQVDGKWFAMEMKGDGSNRYKNGAMAGASFILRRSKLDLNPDFEKLDAFVLHIPDGTRASTDNTRGVPMVWRGGKIVPKVDPATTRAIDDAVESLRATTRPAR